MTTTDKIALFSAIGGWVSGIGTLIAVVVSLYLANRKTKVRIDCVVGERVILTRGLDGGNAQQPGIAIVVTNLTAMPINLTSIGWSCGTFWSYRSCLDWFRRKKCYWHQMLGDVDSEKIPKRIEYGEQGFFWVSLVDREESWFQKFAREMKDKGADPRKLKLSIATSSGGLFYFRPEKDLIDKFLEHFNSV
ncbi:hypothetical protein [Enterobacter kobei]|uniref:hypothetical protein n=1 Tax=Enterobacter kobei TaxID=208224 RepID=UPI003AAFF77A